MVFNIEFGEVVELSACYYGCNKTAEVLEHLEYCGK
jgi:hypothetical protein